METLCPNERQLPEKVQICYLGKARDHTANSIAIFHKMCSFCFSGYHSNEFFWSEHLENEECKGEES